MAKLTKDELIAKINEKLSDNKELAVELMEDITDSFEVEADNSELEEVKTKYDELLDKYKERFMSGNEDDNTEVIDEENKEEVIDVQEI